MKLEKRIHALETKMLSNPVILHFADGSTRVFFGPRYFLLDLFSGVCGGDLSLDQAEHWISSAGAYPLRNLAAVA